jgi:hypothetical protein
MNKKPNPIHTLPEMIKINPFLFKKHLTNMKYNSSWTFLGLLTMTFKSTLINVKIRFKNLTVTLHQIHCSVTLKRTYVMYH